MIPNPYKGKFICVEGLDGSGKDTQGKKLFEFLKSKDFPAILTSEPSVGPIGFQIRKILKKEQPAPKPALKGLVKEIRALNILKSWILWKKLLSNTVGMEAKITELVW